MSLIARHKDAGIKRGETWVTMARIEARAAVAGRLKAKTTVVPRESHDDDDTTPPWGNFISLHYPPPPPERHSVSRSWRF